MQLALINLIVPKGEISPKGENLTSTIPFIYNEREVISMGTKSLTI